MSDSTLEKYRYAFLHYIISAREVVEVWQALNHVLNFQYIIADGRSYSSTTRTEAQKKEATEVGKILLYRYGLKFSSEGLEKALVRLQAEYDAAKEQEDFLWHRLAQVVQEVWAGKSAWFDGSAALHRALMTNGADGLTLDRLRYYEQALKNIEYPTLPFELEIEFRFLHVGLMHLVPFNER